MTIRKINREDFANKISREFGISYTLAYSKVESLISCWTKLIIDQNNLNISSLGSFVIRKKQSRIGRNPKSKREHLIKSRKVITFKKSNKLNI